MDAADSRPEAAFEAREEPSSRFDLWQRRLTDLIAAYQDTQKRALALPALVGGSSRASGQGLRRSPGPGKGEITGGAIAPRFAVDYLLTEHIASRLTLVRRSVLLDDGLTKDQQDRLLETIDRVLPIWPRRPFLGLIYQYLLPIVGTLLVVGTVSGRLALAGIDALVANPLNLWRFFPPILAVGYVALLCLLPCFAFVVKRGLMMGGRDSSACVPVLLDGQGTYGVEARLFGVLIPRRREVPFDLVLFSVAWLLAAIGVEILTRLPGLPLVISALFILLLIGLVCLAVLPPIQQFRERRRLGRW